MSHHHERTPRPDLGCYILREVHDGKPDGVLAAAGAAQEKEIAAAAAILAVQGYACRLVRMVDEAVFAGQEAAYRAKVLPPSVPVLSLRNGESPAQLAQRMASILRGEE